MTALDSVAHAHAALAVVAPAGLAVDVACQLLICRLPLSIGHVRRQFASFGLGFAATAAGSVALLAHQRIAGPDFAGYFVLHLLSYILFGFCFFHVINLNVSSLRIRILKEYYRQDPDPLPEAALIARYNVRDMLDARLARLQSGNQISASGDRFLWRPSGVSVLGRIFVLLRRLLLPG